MKKLLTGNEAIAEGIIESGVEVVTGYPGTPSTEVVLTLLPQKEELGVHNFKIPLLILFFLSVMRFNL